MADTRIGGVYATFRADNNPWLRASRQNVAALQRQSRATRRLSQDARALRTSVQGAIGALGLFAGGAGLAALTRSVFQAGEGLSAIGASLVENSNRFGATAEQLQLLGRAFEGGGASQKSFLTALRSFARNLTEAQQGMESYRRAFRLANVDVDELARNNVGLVESFFQLSDGLQGIDGQLQRVNVAQTLLGRAGTDLLFVMQQGSQAVRDQAEGFRSLGILTDQQSERLKALNQTYVDSNNAVRTARAQVVADNAELFASINRTYAEALPRLFRGLIETINFLRENMALASRAVAIFIGVLISRGAVGRFAVGIFAAARAVGVLTVAARAAAVAGRLMLRAFAVGFVLEGLLAVIDAFAVIRSEARRTGNSIQDVFLDTTAYIGASLVAGVVEGLARAAFAVPRFVAFIADQIAGILGPGDITEFTRSLYEGLSSIPGEIAQVVQQSILGLRQGAEQGGSAVAEAFVSRIRERYSTLGDDLPELPPLKVPDLAFRPGQLQEASAELRAVQQAAEVALGPLANATESVSRSVQDQVAARRTELTLLRQGIGETDRRRIVTEGLARFDQAQLVLTRQREDAQARLSRVQAAAASASRRGAQVVAAELQKQVAAEEKKLRLVNAQLATNAATRKELEARLSVYGRELEVIGESIARLETQKEVFTTLSEAVGNFAGSAVLDFNKIGDSFRNIARQILADLTRILVVRQITSAIGGLFGIPGLQSGGFHGGGLALVGEGGPELVDFNRPGRVYTNEELAGAVGGGGGSTFNFAPIIQSADASAVRRAVSEAFPVFEARVLGRLGTDSGRPSSLRSSLRGAN